MRLGCRRNSIKVFHTVPATFGLVPIAMSHFRMVDEIEPGVAARFPASVISDKDILEHVYRIHNAVDGNERNVKLELRSLSVGDMVSINGRCYVCAPLGWERVLCEHCGHNLYLSGNTWVHADSASAFCHPTVQPMATPILEGEWPT